jgi:hypothetical protein
MSFANLKTKRNQISDLLAAADAAGGGATGKKSYGDDRLWKPTVDKMGNGFAVLRFLPAAEGQALPWVRYFDHGFQGPGGWYIEKSLTTLNEQDPVSEYNSTLWNNGTEEGKTLARKQKRRLHYVVNALIVSDPANPANEGKVMLYQFGKKIYDKIIDAMQPEFADEKPVDPFNFWEGADFKLKIRQVEGYRNYDKSEFASQSALSDNDAEFIDPKNFKSYDELKARFEKVTGQSTMTTQARQDLSVQESAPPMATATAPSPQTEFAPVTAEAMETSNDDDTLSYFSRLTAED